MKKIPEWPKTYLIGHTIIREEAIQSYLNDTSQSQFTFHPADLRSLISFYAKLCYKSLVVGKNKNVTKVRGVEDNFENIIKQGHGSVLEHITFNFVTTGCSRIFTHELVRHRVGTAYSQTSGRYVTVDDADLVIDPILGPWSGYVNEIYGTIIDEIGDLYTAVGLNGFQDCLEEQYGRGTKEEELPAEELHAFAVSRGFEHRDGEWVMPFSHKKKLTSACRRLVPNGVENEIGWSANLRALRHMIEMRTSLHAEEEIRKVFMDVAQLIPQELLCGGVQHDDGSWTGLKV